MTITYYADFDQDGSYTDISAYVQSAEWSVGIMKPFDRLGHLNYCRLALVNTDGKWNGEDTTNRISAYLNTPFPVQIKSGSTVLFWGRAQSLQQSYYPAGTTTAKTFATLEAVGDRDYADSVEADLRVFENYTSDALIKELILQIPEKPIAGRFIIGVSEIGGTDTIGGIDDNYTGETGVSVFGKYPVANAGMQPDTAIRNPDAANMFRASNSISARMQEIIDAEGGWLIEGREGWLFWKSQHDFGSVAGTVSDTGTYKPQSVQYGFAPDHYNYIIAYSADEVDETEVTLWELRTSVTVPGNSEVKLTVKHKADELPASATNVKVRDVQWQNVGQTSEGIIAKGDHSIVTFTNDNAADNVVLAAKLVGERIRSTDELLIIKRSIDVSAKDQARPLRLNLRALDDYDRADTVANLELLRRKPLKYAVSQMTMRNDGTHPLWAIGTRLTIDLDSLNHDRDYVIIGEKHNLQAGGTDHTITYILQAHDQMSLTGIWDKTGHTWGGNFVWGD